jgi:hypothetical protein
MMEFLEKHSSEIMILALVAMVMASLLVLVPQLLRAHARNQELRQAERLAAIQHGLPFPPQDDRARAAGRTAVLVPIVAVIVAGVVTCFLVAYRSENVLAVTIAVWIVAGVVSLAAITGGVALVGRLAQIESGDEEEPSRVTRT